MAVQPTNQHSQKPFDEIVISTLPTAISRVVDMALPEKIAQMTDTKISVIHASDDPAFASKQ